MQDLQVPVFLGDALQWDVRPLGDRHDVEFPVPNEPPLRVPAGFAEDQTKYEPGLKALTDGLNDNASLRRSLLRISGVDEADAAAIANTSERLLALCRSGRNHIWPYVLRNPVRPLWLSRSAARDPRCAAAGRRSPPHR